LNNHDDLLTYLSLSSSIGALFSYMSSIIFKKSNWDKTGDKEYACGTCYGHVYILLSLIRYTCILKYIREPLVLCRFGNDSFSDNGLIRRVSIDFDGYCKIAEKLFINDPVTKALFKAVLKKEYPSYRLVKIRAFSNDDEWRAMVCKLLDIGYKSPSISICGMLGRHKPAIRNLIKFKHKIEKMRSAVCRDFHHKQNKADKSAPQS